MGTGDLPFCPVSSGKDELKVNWNYHIKSAHLFNGIDWVMEGTFAIDFSSEKEKNIARSAVIKDEEKYKVWFSYVPPETEYYRIEYAESNDFKTWDRKDMLARIDVIKDGFDNKMVVYTIVYKYKHQIYMLYNGNNFGENGFCIATW